MSSRVRLGTVRAPSGIVVVLDAGYAGLWCDAAEDFDDDSGWPLSEKDRQLVKDSVDLRIIGPDAAEAGRRFGRQWHPLWLYDIPKDAIAEIEQLFCESIDRYGLDATLSVEHRRIAHRERVSLALEQGGGAGEIQISGVWATVCGGIPMARELPVFAEAMPTGPESSRWRRVFVEIHPAVQIASSQKIGQSGVDWARLVFADADAVGEWQHHDALNGKADCVFWGRDAQALADAVRAQRLSATEYGWLALPVTQAEERLRTVEQTRVERGWKVALDFRPHSHHWQLMQQVRASRTESGTVEIGAAKLCGFMTSWGDGIFDVLAERDAVGRLVRLTVDCGSDAMVDRQRRFEERWAASDG
jgi:hypothetical protein